MEMHSDSPTPPRLSSKLCLQLEKEMPTTRVEPGPSNYKSGILPLCYRVSLGDEVRIRFHQGGEAIGLWVSYSSVHLDTKIMKTAN